jgi:hypothetical protein
MAAKTKLLVKVPDLEGFPSYRRAGLVLTQGDNIVEVDQEQAAKLRADPRLLVTDAPKDEPKKAEK